MLSSRATSPLFISAGRSTSWAGVPGSALGVACPAAAPAAASDGDLRRRRACRAESHCNVYKRSTDSRGRKVCAQSSTAEPHTEGSLIWAYKLQLSTSHVCAEVSHSNRKERTWPDGLTAVRSPKVTEAHLQDCHWLAGRLHLQHWRGCRERWCCLCCLHCWRDAHLPSHLHRTAPRWLRRIQQDKTQRMLLSSIFGISSKFFGVQRQGASGGT